MSEQSASTVQPNHPGMGSARAWKLAVLNSHPIQYFAPLYRRLAREPGIDLTVYFCSRQGLEEYQDPEFGTNFRWDLSLLDGYRSRFLPNLRRSDEVAGFFSLVNPHVIEELRRERYNALWVHGHAYATHLLAMAAARLLGTPVLMRGDTHLLLQRSPLKRMLRQVVMRFLYRQFCAACLPIGTRNREFYLAHGVDADRLFLVPYTVDNAFFAQDSESPCQRDGLRARLAIAPEKYAVLFASKLTPRKRPMDLLMAYHRVRLKRSDITLVFVGSGEEEARLRQYTRNHNIPDVHFAGFRNQSEIRDYYRLADIFVLPAENEPWGLVINEAMAASLPLIASDEIGAVADLLKPGDNGFAYPAGDVAALSRWLEILVSNGRRRQEMGRRSREMIEDWGLELCVRGIEAALETTAGRPRAITQAGS